MNITTALCSSPQKGVDAVIGFMSAKDQLLDVQRQITELEPYLNALITKYNKLIDQAKAISEDLESKK